MFDMPPDQAVIVQFAGYGDQHFRNGERDLAPLERLHLDIEGTLSEIGRAHV